ncbi:MAG: hypothetical protein NT072_08865, partial [Deltaproteobacteria bacterium]|nr:hypothetical protein [Deltaproteobacteria bacterium]
MKRISNIRRLFIFIIAVAVILFTHPEAALAGAKVSLPADAGIGETTVTWHEGPRIMRARMALDQMAVITEKGITPDKEGARGLFHPAARAEKSDSLILLRSPETFSREVILEKIHAVGALAGVAGASPVFFRGATCLIPTGRIICRFRDSVADDAVVALEKKYGLEKTDKNPGRIRHLIYRAADPLRSIEIAEALAAEEGVEFAYPDWLRSRSKKTLPDDTLFKDQWHLRNTGQNEGTPGEDINV